MPGGNIYGSRRPAVEQAVQKKGYRKSELAKLVGMSPQWIGTLAKRGSLIQLDDGSLDKKSAHNWFAEELVGTGVLLPKESQDKADDALAATRAQVEEAKAELYEVAKDIDEHGNPIETEIGPTGEVLYFDITRERSRLLHYQAEVLRLKSAKEEGSLIPRYETESAVTEICKGVCDQILTLADRVAPIVTGIRDEREVWHVVNKESELVIDSMNRKFSILLESLGKSGSSNEGEVRDGNSAA